MDSQQPLIGPSPESDERFKPPAAEGEPLDGSGFESEQPEPEFEEAQ